MTSTSRGLVPGLAVTETVSWGILYYAFPVLLPAMERDLGWSRTTLIGAYTAAVIVSGLAALLVGRLLDHHPARPLMTAGSVVATAAVLG
jgi:MFS family permease